MAEAAHGVVLVAGKSIIHTYVDTCHTDEYS